MTTYLGEKAVGLGTIKATKAVAGDVLHDGTLVGNGNTEPLGVNKQVIATTNQVANLSATLHAEIEEQAGKITKLDSKKIDKDQGATNAGKYLMVGSDGIVGLSESGGDVIHNNTMVGTGKKDSPLGVNTEVVATKSDIPTKTSQLKNDSGFLTEHQDISGKQDKLTAGENITIENGVISATGGGGELPDNVLVNNSSLWTALSIGTNANADAFGVALGNAAKTLSTGSIAIGSGSNGNGAGIAIGMQAKTGSNSKYAIQLGFNATNSDSNTFKVANANGNFEMMSADGTIPADRMSTTAGTTGQVLTKTDTGMEWQDATGGSGGELPDNVLVNKPNGKKSSLVITPDYDGNYGAYNVSIGAGVVDSRNYSVHIGYDSLDSTTTGCSVGIGSKTRTAAFSVAIGYDAEAIAQYSIQIGSGENKDANTLKVSNANGNFEMMSADGTIPLERLTKVTDQIGDISTALTAILGE